MAKSTGKLSERAMIVQLNLRAWQGQRVDKKVTKEVLEQRKAAKDAGRFSKYLVPQKALEPIHQAQAHARAQHYDLTLPWGENTRILNAEALFIYNDAMEVERLACVKTYDAFAKIYPQLKAEAPARLNGLYRAEDFPDETTMRTRFGFRLRVLPVPEAGDFRVDLTEELQQEMRESVERTVAEYTDEAQNALWERLKDVVEHFVLTMADPKKKFKDSTVTNMLELAKLAPKLSLERGSMLTVCTAINDLGLRAVPTTLRKSPTIRKRTAEEAKVILAQITKALA